MFRDQFQYPDRAYFLSHSVGVQPKAVTAALEETYLAPWRAARGDAWDYWMGALKTFKENLALLIGANAKDICQQANVSSALTKILFSLPDRPGRRKIVLTEEDFPTIGHVLMQAERAGYELVFLSGGVDLADVEYWTSALSEDVQLLHITHVFSNRGVRPPVEAIIKRAKALGIYTVVDIAQSAGAVPIELNQWQPDFATGTSVKYLCGGPGAAYLWANPDSVENFRPVDVGWFSQSAPFPSHLRKFDYAEDATRFLGGTPSVAPYAMAAASFKVLSEIGVDSIFAHNQALLSKLIANLPVEKILSHTEKAKRGSAMIIKPRDLEAASATLMEQGFVHDQRMDGLRLSMHLYNSDDEVGALVEALAPLL